LENADGTFKTKEETEGNKNKYVAILAVLLIVSIWEGEGREGSKDGSKAKERVCLSSLLHPLIYLSF